MSDQIVIAADTYAPGSTLEGEVALSPAPGDEGQRVELSVLWEARGGGQTDAVAIYHAVLCEGDPAAGRATHAFTVTLPALPLSYRGKTLQIVWRVRVRRLSLLGDDQIVSRPFTLEWS